MMGAGQIVPGTLDMLILRALATGDPKHGYAIAERLKQCSGSVLEVGESALYPALQRLLLNGWVTAKWGVSENNRRARYYSITASGRKRLLVEQQEFERIVAAIKQVFDTA